MSNALRYPALPFLLALLLVGVAAGAAVAFANPALPFAVLLGVIGAAVLARDVQRGLYGVMAIVTLLPFAAVPLNIGFAPTFLDIATLLLVAAWFVQLAGGRRAWHSTALDFPVTLFLALALVAFVLGLGVAGVTVATLRRFVEILIAVSLYFVVANVLRERADLERAVKVLLVLGFAVALTGIALYVMPNDLANRLLNSLRVVRYPTGEVLRFIEDNPDMPKRAIATSVDPNVLGGLLILLLALLLPQWRHSTGGVTSSPSGSGRVPSTGSGRGTTHPLFGRKTIALMTGAMGLCLLLTFSRGSLLGATVAAGFIVFAWLSRRYSPPVATLLSAGGALAAIAAGFGVLSVLPWTQAYAAHLVEGLLGQDRATLMRFGEYKDAFNLIARYPLFGVGFTGVPDIDLYVGVSSLYLLMASRMGLIGLAAFLFVIAVFFLNRWRAYRTAPTEDPILLGAIAAILGALVGGIFDHYFFNLDFPHSVTLFWLVVGIAMSARAGGGEQ